MRVLSNAPDPRFSGPLKRSLSVARRLRAREIDTVFLVPNGDDAFVERAQADGFECLRIDQPRIRSPDKIRENVTFLTRFPRLVQTSGNIIDAQDVDIVHVNGPLNYAVALTAARSNASLAWHFNDTLTPTPLKQISATLASRWADQRLVAADAVAEYFFGDTAETRTVYAPVDLNRFDPDQFPEKEGKVRDELGIDKETSVVGTIGNINPAKGHEYLIESFASVSEDAHLVIVGRRLDSQQNYYERLKQRIQSLGIESSVTFTGWREDIPSLLAAFDVFVLASVTEACPMVVLEAMAMKCPSIATDVGGVREQIPGSDYGWVVPPEDPSALSMAIHGALTSESDRTKRAEMARRRVENVFSLESCVETHVAVYTSLGQDSTT